MKSYALSQILIFQLNMTWIHFHLKIQRVPTILPTGATLGLIYSVAKAQYWYNDFFNRKCTQCCYI